MATIVHENSGIETDGNYSFVDLFLWVQMLVLYWQVKSLSVQTLFNVSGKLRRSRRR